MYVKCMYINEGALHTHTFARTQLRAIGGDGKNLTRWKTIAAVNGRPHRQTLRVLCVWCMPIGRTRYLCVRTRGSTKSLHVLAVSVTREVSRPLFDGRNKPILGAQPKCVKWRSRVTYPKKGIHSCERNLNRGRMKKTLGSGQCMIAIDGTNCRKTSNIETNSSAN